MVELSVHIDKEELGLIVAFIAMIKFFIPFFIDKLSSGGHDDEQ